ncbi:MAG: hypothetical protein NXH86_04280 [Flavobacteriaceae bacterium]|nr:hypothetical protein [Flavobacteriaceae bacterium]
MESIEYGWVITAEDGAALYGFTFSRTRTEAINEWVSLWDRPNNWKAHYRKGHRCVKAKKITTTEPTNK